MNQSEPSFISRVLAGEVPSEFTAEELSELYNLLVRRHLLESSYAGVYLILAASL